MQLRIRLLSTAVVTFVVLGLAGSASTANRSITRSGSGTYTGSGPITFRGTEAESLTITCNLSSTKNMHSVIAKVREALVGFTWGGLEGCINPRYSVLGSSLGEPEHPWHLRYQGFNGTLPRISGIIVQTQRVQFLFRIEIPLLGRMGCLFEGVMTTTWGGNPVTRLLVGETTLVLVTQLENMLARCPPSVQTPEIIIERGTPYELRLL